ncbi:hypothetical protein [Bacillus thuringiensis]|uniref:hypothetical protein n=1 Tax=Bacillus thuringiensis TaxID=1428 RepID=UPI0011A2CD81|nr:hypothetical protein [Bacillus thuringiensis]
MEASMKMTTENERIIQTYLNVWEQRILNFISDPNPNHNQDLQHFLPDFTVYAATQFPHLFHAYTKYLMLYTTKVLNRTPHDTEQIYSLLEKICGELKAFIHGFHVDSNLVATMLQPILASKKQLSFFGNHTVILSSFDVPVFERIWIEVEEMIGRLFQIQEDSGYVEMGRSIEELANYMEDIPLSAGKVYIQFLIEELLREVKEPTVARTRVLDLLAQLCKETQGFIEFFTEKSESTQNLEVILEDIEIQIQLYLLFFEA